MKVMTCFATGVLLAASGSHVAMAQEHRAVRANFELPAKSGKTILVFRPSVSVGAQSTGGMFEPNGDWTDQARKNIDDALAMRQAELGNTVMVAPSAFGDEAQLVEEYQTLFGAVSRAVIEYQFFKGNRLPTKKRENKDGVFEWSLGSGVSALPGAKNADYALFIYNKDAYGSTGRKILQMVALLGPGIVVKSGEHSGFAGLVDLKTGDILWLNADMAMGGDVRTPEGAHKRVGQLLEEFPGSVPSKPAVTKP